MYMYMYMDVYMCVECVWKDGERTVSRAKSGETLVEASRDTNAQIVRYTFFSWERKANRTISRLVPSNLSHNNCYLPALSGKANDWKNREHVVLDLFSNLNMGNIQWLLSVSLWGPSDNPTWAVLRGLFLVSRTGDDRRV